MFTSNAASYRPSTDLDSHILDQAMPVPQPRGHDASELLTSLQQNRCGIQHVDVLHIPVNRVHTDFLNVVLRLT